MTTSFVTPLVLNRYNAYLRAQLERDMAEQRFRNMYTGRLNRVVFKKAECSRIAHRAACTAALDALIRVVHLG